MAHRSPRTHETPEPRFAESTDCTMRDNGVNQKGLAELFGYHESKVTAIRHGTQKVRAGELCEMAMRAQVPVEAYFDGAGRPDLYEAGDVRWRMAGRQRDLRTHARRLAAHGVLLGLPAREIISWLDTLYLNHGHRRPGLDEKRLRDKAQGAVRSGLVEIVASRTGEELEDRELAAELAASLAARSPRGRAPAVHVVRNLCHPSFAHDPLAPILLAFVAHRLVADLLRTKFMLRVGLAGGIHCECFSRMTGPGSSPFPDDLDRRVVHFVPLTLEPFHNLRLPMAGAVVEDMTRRASDLLGAQDVEGFTIRPFGFLEGNRFVEADSDAIVVARGLYGTLDVAIFGCGDLEQEGWLSEVLRRVNVQAPDRTVTDVCLNLLDGEGVPVPLSQGRQFVGVGLPDIQKLVELEDRMALLLTSGRAKGQPLSIVARSGYADTVVCDQAAARAALALLA